MFQVFADSKSVKVEVVDDQAVITKEYPLMAAVNRCANVVPRHQVSRRYYGKITVKQSENNTKIAEN